jgi:FemAB-related protein (PEP-CTERM system-associated)
MVRLADATDAARWDAYVSSSPAAHAYHLWAWRRIIEASFNHRTYYLLSENAAGDIDGVLPLARLRSRMFGDFLVSLPYVNYAGPNASNVESEQRLVDAAVDLAAQQNVNHLELRTEASSEGSRLRVRAAKVSMRLSLPPTVDALWHDFPTKLRTKIRRVQQENLTVRMGGAELLDAFYHVFSINMRDLGTPVYGQRFFQIVLEHLGEAVRIGVVYFDDEPIAAGFLVGFRDVVEIPWGSSLRRFNHLRANLLLYWHLLQFSCEQGYRTFDFGRSSPDSGPYQFKAQWDATPVPLHWQYWVRGNAPLPNINPQNPRYRLAVRVWQRLPVPVTKMLGPSIVRNIP